MEVMTMKKRLLDGDTAAILPPEESEQEGEPLPSDGAEEPEQIALQRVQALIDALPAPEDITAGNWDEVEAQLEAIGEAWAELSGEEALLLDTARLEAARDALAALDGQAENELPAPLADMVDGVEYWDENGNKNTQNNVTVVDNSTTWTEDWYVVNGNVQLPDRITVSGDVHLILMDGKTLTANSGINVGENQSLTIYGQSGGTGTLIATGISGAAGIGGNEKENTGSIVINGGTVTATGGSSGAGIGGGYKGERGTVTINGGTVTAKAASGIEQGAGIGAGANAVTGTNRRPGSIGDITITGGIVNAAGGNHSAGIGYGNACKEVGTITISGGIVTATGGNNAAGIQGLGDSVFSTGQDGSAFILASCISDKFSREDWSGIIFEGNAG